MASSSSSNFAPAAAAASSCRYWNVFLSFRGEDTRKSFVDHLYLALQQRLIRVYKDDEALPRGDSIGPSLLKAIEESQIALIVFSKNYADSSWCLDELVYCMKCRDERRLIVMPIFYDVDPSDVRNQKRKFGEAFAKQEAKNMSKAELWRKALFDASNIAGWEPKHIANGHESKVIKEIVDTVQDRLFPFNLDVDAELVGMKARFQDLLSRLDIGSGGVNMIGIWGIGGSGKTTLAFSIYMRISGTFQGHCFIANIREQSKHGLETLQSKILSTILKTKVKVQSVEEGKCIIKSRLCNSKVLVILDDVDDLGQLQALAGSHNWFGSGSRIIITTRDEHLLRTHRVDHISPIRLLSHEEAIWLFYKYAFDERKPLTDYKKLSLRVVSYAAGLPLALKVLGSFLFDKDESEWVSTLAKLKDIPNIEVTDILRISYDGLETYQRELFLDIACFFRGERTDNAMEILDACGYHPTIGIKVLRQKALITIDNGMFNMHDLIQEMGHYIVRWEYPFNPEKHTRVWRKEEISRMSRRDATFQENHNIEVINSDFLWSMKVISNMKNLRWLSVVMHHADDWDKHIEGPSFLSNELRYLHWEKYPASPFPDSFQPMNLVVLKLHYSLQKELWNGCKCLPRLKVLQLCYMENLHNTPDFNGLPYLQKLEISNCDKLEEIHPSLGNHGILEYVSVRSCKKLLIFPMIVEMKKLKTLEIENCDSILELPKIQSDMESLVTLSMKRICKRVLPEILFNPLTRKLNASSLKKLDLSGWGLKDEEIPSDIGDLSNLEELDLSQNDFSRLGFSLSQLTRLKILILSKCKRLVELPELPSSTAVLEADECDSLTNIGNNFHTAFKWLCKASLLMLRWRGSVNGVGRLLESMLQGMGINNHCMVLRCEGEEIPKRFLPCLVRGNACTLRLPENWCNDFSGFVMCAVRPKYSTPFSYIIRIQKVISHITSVEPTLTRYGDVALEKSIGDQMTWVGYVSFASVRHTSWWNETHSALLFSFDDVLQYGWFGIGLVPKTRGITPTETSTGSLAFPCLNILDDSASALKIEFRFSSQYKLDNHVSDTAIKPQSIRDRHGISTVPYRSKQTVIKSRASKLYDV